LTVEDQPTVYNAADGQVLAILSGHQGGGPLGCAVDGAHFSPDGKLIYTAAQDGTIRVWDTAGVLQCSILEGAPATHLTAIALSPAGRRAATSIHADKDRTIRVWDLVEGRELLKIPMPQAYASGIAFSPDGSTIAGICTDGRVRRWEASTGNELFTLPG